MTEIIDLNQRREAREAHEAPDPRYCKTDEFGRSIFVFILEYEMDGNWYGIDLWAHDFAEAGKMAAAMRNGIVVVGKKMGEVPW